jgi:hypothetical protein
MTLPICRRAPSATALVVCFLALAGRAAGTIYYISDCAAGAAPSCVAGNDANSGTSQALPWKTFDKARGRFKTLAAGDQLLFARGGSFTTAGSQPLEAWVNANGSAANPIVVGAYTPAWAIGGEGRPIVTNATGGIFVFQRVSPGVLTQGVVVRDLALRGGDVDEGVWFYRGVRDVVLDNLLIDGFELGVYLATPVTPADSNDAITLRNSRVINNSGQGWLGSGAGVVIENNDFENNGFAEAVFNHNLYVGGIGSDVVIRGNRLFRSTMVGGECRGVSLVIHGYNPRLLVENNTVVEELGAAGGGCWGIQINAVNARPETFAGSIVRGNKVIDAGNAAIVVANCPDCVIENNVVVHRQAFSVRGILIADGVLAPDDAATTNVTVRNNSIYTTASESLGITLGEEGVSHSIVSNAIVYGGNGGYFTCLSVGLPEGSYEAIDYNLCHMPGATFKRWAEGVPYSNDPLVAWQSASPYDDNSRLADPQFSNPAGGDLTFGSSGSPLQSAGHPTLSALRDANGALRPSPPAIGAYERLTATAGTRFYTLVPCRLLDTRDVAGPFGGPQLAPGVSRTFDLAGRCGIPADARAVSLNVTVVGAATSGLLRGYAFEEGVPGTWVSTFTAGVTRANNAVVKVASGVRAALTLRSEGAGVHVLADVNGYFR